MSKKKTGLLIALGAALGTAAAGISYYLKYKSFNDEVEKDFHDYEDDDSFETEMEDKNLSSCESAGRTYITLDGGKCKSCEKEETCEEPCETACPKEAPTAATVEEDTEGVNE